MVSLLLCVNAYAGVGQWNASFWRNIEHNYNSKKVAEPLVHTFEEFGREVDWDKDQANKFEIHYMTVLHENRSGYNDRDKVRFKLLMLYF